MEVELFGFWFLFFDVIGVVDIVLFVWEGLISFVWKMSVILFVLVGVVGGEKILDLYFVELILLLFILFLLLLGFWLLEEIDLGKFWVLLLVIFFNRYKLYVLFCVYF